MSVSTTESSGLSVLAIYPSEQPTAFGDDPEGTAASVPRERRATISTTNLKMAELTAEAPHGSGATPNSPGVRLTQPSLIPICDPADPGCTDPEPPPPPPPAPQGYAPSEVGGFTWSGCTSVYYTDDRDQDGVHDECEHQLAYAFRPYLSVSDKDADPGREPYWAASRGTRYYDQGRPIIQIVYALSYYRDTGDPDTFVQSAHMGDSEFIHYWVEYVNGRWVLTQVFTSAHWNAHGESSRTSQYNEMEYPNGRARTRPLIYVSRGKHANYNTRSGCNYGGYWHNDDCIYNRFVLGDPAYEVEVLRGANLGNKYAPGGPTGPDGLTRYPRGVQLYDDVASRRGRGPAGAREWYWRGLVSSGQTSVYAFCGWQSAVRPTGGCAGPYESALRWLSL